VVISTGNVTISCNITYASLKGITDISKIPSFLLVVKGANIYVVPPNPPTSVVGVTQLAGTYVAEANTTGGGYLDDTTLNVLDVCPKGDLTTTGPDNTCSADRLVVDGSFIANKLELYRTYGTLSASSYNSPTPSDPYAAEEFDYSPINWLSSGASNGLTVQSVTALPPVL
jgi:hypothetical protein